MEQKAVRHMYVYLLVLAVAITGIMLTGNAHAADTVAQVPPVTLQQSFAQIIQSATSGVQAGVEFLKQEVPDVIRQLLVWKAVQAGFWAMFYFVGVVIGVIAVRNGVGSIIEQVRLNTIAVGLSNKADAIGYRSDGYAAAKAEFAVADAADDAHIPKTIFGVIFGIVLGIFGIVSFVNVWSHALTVAQIYIAPKVWLIEYGASLIK